MTKQKSRVKRYSDNTHRPQSKVGVEPTVPNWYSEGMIVSLIWIRFVLLNRVSARAVQVTSFASYNGQYEYLSPKNMHDFYVIQVEMTNL